MNIVNRGFIRLFERYMPDPLVLAALLSIAVFIAGMVLNGVSPIGMSQGWYGGFFTLHGFAMQMILILVGGYALARSPAFGIVIDKIAVFATTPERAIVLVTTCTLLACWVNWGVGLVAGAVLARELARKVKGVDYRVLIAGAYSAFIVWHGGLSGSSTLLMATEGNFLQEAAGGLIPVSETIFSALNLTLSAAVSVTLVMTFYLISRSITEPVGIPVSAVAPGEPEIDTEDDGTPASRLERSRLLGAIIGLAGLATIAVHFSQGGGLNLDAVIFILIFVGMLLHGSLGAYLRALKEGVSGATGVVIQFPFYAGIMGMMASSGMSADLVRFFSEFATVQTLPFLTFLSAGLLNILVPSGGGQWAIQGPIAIETAMALGASPARSVVAFAWGDAWTNLIQPFWALPALAIAGLRAKDIMGFCALALLTTGTAIGVILLIAGFL